MSEEIAGQQARKLRRAKGMTLDVLAEMSSLSKGHLSRFERGEKTLSVAALLRIADALDTRVSVLLGEDVEDGEIFVTRAGKRKTRQVGSDESAYAFSILSEGAKASDRFEAFILDLHERVEEPATVSHAGEELLFVLEGALTLSIGRKKIKLAEGDCVQFPGWTPHVLRSITGSSRCLILILPN